MPPSASRLTQRGFTLIELMIVVAIIAILAAIAIPNYNEHVMKARITDAVAKLSDTRVRMEQYFQDNRNYGGACAAGTLAPAPSDTEFFTYTCGPGGSPITAGSTTFTITASGIGKMSGFTYTINETNTRTTVAVPAGWAGSGKACWVLNKGGGC